jgi:hypothetical protein
MFGTKIKQRKRINGEHIMQVNWFITDQNVTVNYNGQTHIVKKTEPLAADLIRAIKEGRMDDVPNLVSVAQAMENKSKGNVVVRDGELFVKGVKVPVELARKIQRFIDEGLPYQPLVKFAENLSKNPSFRAVNELFQFLEKNDHPFTESGNFIAYKRVKSDFKDIHSGTFDNSPGNTLEMPRNQVNEDPNQTCSFGLHVANWDYAHTQFGSAVRDTDIMLEVEVNPADVVAVPADYNQAKMRTCKYKVLGVVQTEFKGSNLRVTSPDHVFDNEERNAELDGEEPENTCIECGVETEVGRFCEDCDGCEECGDLVCSCQEEYCVECGEDACVCDDPYPWDSELNN